MTETPDEFPSPYRDYRNTFAQEDPYADLRQGHEGALSQEDEPQRNLLRDLSVEDLAAAADAVVAEVSPRVDGEESEEHLDPQVLAELRQLVADFDEEHMSALIQAVNAYQARLGEESDEDDDEAGNHVEESQRSIDIETGTHIPNLSVYDETVPHEDYLDDAPTAEDLQALREVEAELNTRWGERKIAPDLSRMEKLMDLLGHPERSYPVIHVAGTNGKSSTTRMIDALLRAMGQRVGRTTSPHLQSPTERIAVDGRPISPRRYVEVWEDIKPFVLMVDDWSHEQGGPRMTKFEVLTAMSYACFADTPVDVVVAEVGMGGRWDATSVARGDIAVICPIGMDHTDYLGDTLEEIAAEKAGIIRATVGENTAHNPHGTIAVIAHQAPAALRVIMERCAEVDAIVARQGIEFMCTHQSPAVGGQLLNITGLAGQYEGLFLPLVGQHQASNAAVALAAVEAFYGAHPGKPLYDQAVHSGFAAAQSPGRLERVRTDPPVLIDAAHNPHGAQALAHALEQDIHYDYCVAVVGILGDKDARGILEALAPVVDRLIVTQTDSPRALSVSDLREYAEDVCESDRVSSAATLVDAVDEALYMVSRYREENPAHTAGVIVTGSVVTAGQARDLFHKMPI